MCRFIFKKYKVSQLGRYGLRYSDDHLTCWFEAGLPGKDNPWLIELSKGYDLVSNQPVEINDPDLLANIKANFEDHFGKTGALVEFLYHGVLWDRYFESKK